MKTKPELETEIKRLESELKTLQKKYDYSRELVNELRDKWIKQRDLVDEIEKQCKIYLSELSTRKKSLLQRWLGI